MKTMSMACAVAVMACLPASSAFAESCENLAKLALKGTAITKAEVVAPGTFQPPDGPPRGRNPYMALGQFCRVVATLTPTSDSDIKVEVWLPASELERQVSGGRQRRVGRRHQLRGDGRGAAGRLCHGVDRHRARRRPRHVRARASRKARGLRAGAPSTR